MNVASKGTALGAVAIASWGSLGALGAMSTAMPPYLVLGACFAIATALGAIICLVSGIRPAPVLSKEVLGAAALLSAYHLAYFEAFHHADAIPVSLINYLWPACLIVIGNIFFNMASGWPGYSGAATGFLGVAVLIGDGFSLKIGDALGYGLALTGAVLWATYSNVRRKANFQGVGAMVSICFLAAVFCFVIALTVGESAIELTRANIVVILLLGLGPAGGAFFLWDYGMRFGNAPLLGVMGYSAPVLSTALMVVLGMGEPSWKMVSAVVLISLGGVIVQIRGRSPRSSSKRDPADDVLRT